jgi:hypothetical protein
MGAHKSLGKPVLIPALNANVSKISHPNAIEATVLFGTITYTENKDPN